ncbi:hypothetical protein R1flu_002405 [Riccia fluitans]|uniref:AAA+ ATPase domain-containing protein n=1 Tax=Riccia fluitans TaxID=41844 RepID=A0ABD1Y625_9MARC
MSVENWMPSMEGDQRNEFSRRLLTTVSDMAQNTTFQSYVLGFFAVYYVFGIHRHFLLLKVNALIRKIKDQNHIQKKQEILDSLAASFGSRESVPGEVADQEVFVHVGDGDETGLHRPLIPKAGLKSEKPKSVTVTIQFSKDLSDCSVEKLTGALEKFFVATADGDEDVGFLSWLQPARAVQGRVQLCDSTLSELENLHKIASSIGNACTLQVESWGILLEGGNWQLNVATETQVPVIFHSEYAAGLLKFCGSNLERAKIGVTDGKNSIKWQDFRVQKLKFCKQKITYCIEYIEIPVRFSSRDMEELIIYATKRREIAGQSLVIHSTAVGVKDALWITVLERWIIGNLLLFIIVHVIWGFISTSMRVHLSSSDLYRILAISIIVTSMMSSKLGGLGKPCYDFVRVLRTVYFGILDLIKRGPHFSTLSAGKRLSSSSSKFSGSTGKASTREHESSRFDSSSSENSVSTRSFVNSIVKKEKNSSSISKDWEPCIVENVIHLGRSTLRKMDKREDDFDADNNPFVIIYRKDDEKKLPWPEEMRVEVASEHLVKILKKHLPFEGNVFCSERPEVPGRDIFVLIDTLSIEGAGIKEDQLSKAQLHLDLLVKHVKKEYKDASLRLKRIREEKLVTFDMLWAFLHRGQKVVYKCEYTNALLCATVSEKVKYKREGKRCVASVLLKIYYYDGQKYSRFNINRDIVEFGGEQMFEALPVCPINLVSTPEEVLEAEFMDHGRKYYELVMEQNYRYMNYQGAMHAVKNKHRYPGHGGSGGTQMNADGRVMIDTQRFLSINPGFRMFDEDPRSRKCGGAPAVDQLQDYDYAVGPKELSDRKLMFAPGVVLGFSFALRQWGVFRVSGFSDVVYDASAFSELVMDQDDKSLIYSLVSQYVADPQQQVVPVDPIAKKGEGCVILCYGPPGTGKTLTAESLAENLGRPLWALSLSQFGTDPEKLESALSTVLNTASLWQAILLLDEADIFLEKRTSNMDLARNAMIGFTVTERGHIWKTLLSRAGIRDVAMLDELSSLDLNGREIRNVVHAAQVWAKSSNSALEMEHVKYVVEVFKRSVDTLQQIVRDSAIA